MATLASLKKELATVGRIAFSPIRGATHAERLESFYAPQSEGYDAFREKLLNGRRELFERAVGNPTGGVWVDFGAGTGRNLDFVCEKIPQFEAVHLVDLSPSLLKMADRRKRRAGWKNVHLHATDACSFSLPQKADLVTFSYSLSMIPDWFRAVESAIDLLAPGGKFAAVDFFVSRKHPTDGRARHGWWTRTFWPAWFAADGVHVTSEILEYLNWRLKPELFEEKTARVPYVPVGRIPYYRFIGTRR